MKKNICLLLTAVLLFCSACSAPAKEEAPAISMEPQITQMKSICELAVMDCYYHNVAKFREEDAAGFLWWKKDKHFWIEYSGIVKFGIDVSLVNMDIKDNQVTITIPEAEVLSCEVDTETLTESSYIVDKKSADISAEDETLAFKEAQEKLLEKASNDKALLAEARQRAQTLLKDYVTNIGNAMGVNYSIQWVLVDKNGKKIGVTDDVPDVPET